ncbi:MAG TPA: hypothetical protein VLD59_04780 [Steroidobacteraceae bacterium]|nr:hypothetical protein [Steroidobacteraceae bacterium]
MSATRSGRSLGEAAKAKLSAHAKARHAAARLAGVPLSGKPLMGYAPRRPVHVHLCDRAAERQAGVFVQLHRLRHLGCDGLHDPQRIHERQTNVGYAILPQAEPNGLFKPDTSSANWVMCLDAKAGKPVPVFVQGEVIVSPMKLGE